jgi:acetylornithine/N-succinyldiaminopimelate aminotransferase
MSMTHQTSESAQQHWMELEHKYYQGTFKRYPLVFMRGEGTRVWDADGKDYLVSL